MPQCEKALMLGGLGRGRGQAPSQQAAIDRGPRMWGQTGGGASCHDARTGMSARGASMNSRSERNFMVFLLVLISLQVALKLTLWPPEETFDVVLVVFFLLLLVAAAARTIQLHLRVRRGTEPEE